MRVLIMLVVGVLVGALGTVTVIGAMRTATPLPLGLMAVSSHHLGILRDQAAGDACDARDARRRLLTLRVLVDDFEAAFLPLPQGDEAEFRRATQVYRGALDDALAAAPQDCRTLASALGPVADGCKRCHREFKL